MKKAKTIRSVRPNAGATAKYDAALRELIDEMTRSVNYWVRACYRQNEPRIAQDAGPAVELNSVLRALSRRWLKRFDEQAPVLAKLFAKRASKNVDVQMRAALKKAGFSLGKFEPTLVQQDVIRATVEQNVALIKSIPSQYMTEVQGLVMRAVQSGGDEQFLSDQLQKRLGITRRRAESIARDQNSKATSALERSRQREIGIEEAEWRHSSGGHTPRPTHVKMNGKKYKVSEGMYDKDEGRNVWPGELINCRCVSRSVIPGL